jgi:UDP-N-acetylmuramyl pentapeptide phosphotransferase/UDP-N-acetylglucosamine-1-phosphate transferase
MLIFFYKSGLLKKTPYFTKQKIHNRFIPRIGGIAIYFTYLISYLITINNPEDIINFEQRSNKILILSVLPLIIIGTLEDLTGKAGVLYRLAAALISGFLFITLYDSDFINQLLKSTGLTLNSTPINKIIIITILTTLIAFYSNAQNIIDGLNGLCCGIFLTFIFFNFGKLEIYEENLFIIVIIFLMFNWPYPLIFIGDSGAYLLGYIVAVCSLISIANGYDPVVIFLTAYYPVLETLFSVVRRGINKVSITKSDNKHLHTLIYFKLKKIFSSNISNSLSAALIVSTNFLIIYFGIYYAVPFLSIIIITILYLVTYNYLSKNEK